MVIVLLKLRIEEAIGSQPFCHNLTVFMRLLQIASTFMLQIHFASAVTAKIQRRAAPVAEYKVQITMSLIHCAESVMSFAL